MYYGHLIATIKTFPKCVLCSPVWSIPGYFVILRKKSLGGSKYKRAPISHGKTQDFLFKSWWLKICPDFACNDCKGRRPVIQLTRRQENCACITRAKFIPYIFLAANWKSAKRMQWVANQKRRPEKQQLLYLVVGAWDVSEIRFSTQSPHHERECCCRKRSTHVTAEGFKHHIYEYGFSVVSTLPLTMCLHSF